MTNLEVQLSRALEDMLDAYLTLVNCGDCGNWNPEKDSEVIQSRKVLKQLDEPKPTFKGFRKDGL